jgi:hypothetical protein
MRIVLHSEFKQSVERRLFRLDSESSLTAQPMALRRAFHVSAGKGRLASLCAPREVQAVEEKLKRRDDSAFTCPIS